MDARKTTGSLGHDSTKVVLSPRASESALMRAKLFSLHLPKPKLLKKFYSSIFREDFARPTPTLTVPMVVMPRRSTQFRLLKESSLVSISQRAIIPCSGDDFRVTELPPFGY